MKRVDWTLLFMMACLGGTVWLAGYSLHAEATAPHISLVKADWICADHRTKSVWTGKFFTTRRECVRYDRK